MSNIIIPTNVYQQIFYSSGQLINGNITFNVPILLNLFNNQVQNPIDMTVTAYFTDNTPKQILIQGTNYTAEAIQNGVLITLLQNLTNCDYIVFERRTTANFNTNYNNQNTNIKPALNNDFQIVYSAIQENQASSLILNNKIEGLATIEYVNSELALTEKIANKSQPGGYCPLDDRGFIPINFLPSNITGDLTFVDNWNALTNTPNISAGTGDRGQFYICSVSGTQIAPSGVSTLYNIGDVLIYNGLIWVRIPNSQVVLSVNGKIGNVVLNTDDVAEGAINLYFTDPRVEAVAIPLINNAVAGFQTELDNKVTKDIIADFGFFGSPSFSLSLAINSEGLVTNITQALIQISVGQILDFNTSVASFLEAKTDKIIPTQNGNIALLNINDGNLFDSEIVISTDILLFNNSDFRIPTEKASKTYIDNGLALTEKIANKSQPGGYASLDNTGKVPSSQIPGVITGALNFKGSWNALTNTTSLGGTLTSSVGTNADAYLVSVSGSTNLNGIVVWNIGDIVYFDGSITEWGKLQSVNINGVTTWNNLSGDVSVTTDQLPQGTNPNNFYASPAILSSFIATQTTTDLAEGINLYFTDTRAQVASVTQLLQVGLTTQSPSSAVVKQALDNITNSLPTLVIDCGIF